MIPKRLLTDLLANRWLVRGLKLLVVGLVIVFVGGAARDAWRDLSREGVRFDLPLAVASGAALLAAMAPLAWFWRQTLDALGQPAGWAGALSAFYISQLGKYVPGKASVVLIRTERTRRFGGCRRTIAACVFYETLLMMAVGGLISMTLLLAGVGGTPPGQRGWLALLSLGLALACLVPTWPGVARWLLARVAKPAEDDQLISEERPAAEGEPDESIEATERALQRGLTLGLFAEGVAAAVVAWIGMGVSVWLAALSVDAVEGFQAAQLPLWVLAASLPVVAGFISLLPAGLLVRDGMMLGLLAPTVGEAGALATTLAVRLIWVAAEVALCGILIGVWRSPPKPTPPRS